MRFFHATVHSFAATRTVGDLGRDTKILRDDLCVADDFTEAEVSAAVESSPNPLTSLSPFDCTFEEAYTALEALPGLLIEPDGSFVWGAPGGRRGWRLDGVLYDAHGRLQFVELKGCCSCAALDQLLAALGWPERQVVFQLVEQGVFLDEVRFRCEFFPEEACDSP